MPTQSSTPDENLDSVPHVSQPLPTNSGVPLSLPPHDTDPEPPLIPDSDTQLLQRLVSGTVPQDELASLVERMVSDVKPAAIVGCLRGSDAQTFIEVMYKV